MARVFHLFKVSRENHSAYYHKRSNVESTLSMMKAIFGDSLRSETDTAEVNEPSRQVLSDNVCCLIQSAL